MSEPCSWAELTPRDEMTVIEGHCPRCKGRLNPLNPAMMDMPSLLRVWAECSPCRYLYVVTFKALEISWEALHRIDAVWIDGGHERIATPGILEDTVEQTPMRR